MSVLDCDKTNCSSCMKPSVLAETANVQFEASTLPSLALRLRCTTFCQYRLVKTVQTPSAGQSVTQ